MIFMYKLYKDLNPVLRGFENSRITNLPPGFSTLNISLSPFSRFSKFRTPKATVMASNVVSGKFIASLSPFNNSICLLSNSLSTFCRPSCNMPSEMSIPVIFSGRRYFHVIMATSAVPVATSSTCWGRRGFNSAIARLRQYTSMPPDRKRLRKSYRKAIWSNMVATCCFLLSSESLNGTMVSCEYFAMGSKDKATTNYKPQTCILRYGYSICPIYNQQSRLHKMPKARPARICIYWPQQRWQVIPDKYVMR